uniref:Uncharacterized protein n=1 Tax=Oscillatoriales cyanobacterium SpSt-418 TaxID=2282169 RepID=A0A7C3PCL2_9CYAN
MTREQEDTDIAYPGDRTTEFLALLHSRGGVITEQTFYGFLAEMQGILLDCEPCIRVGESYELEGLPPGSCPPEPTESLGGKLICSKGLANKYCTNPKICKGEWPFAPTAPLGYYLNALP